MLTISGLDRRGVARGGRTVVPAAEFAERCFRQGWRSLKLIGRAADGSDYEAAGIRKDPETGERIWWAES
ncbi:MAG: hypothetical protein M3P18_02280 [Actinomycetota bacterium]|nr:hypothetical protein [Actinomycetota bacterium]